MLTGFFNVIKWFVILQADQIQKQQSESSNNQIDSNNYKTKILPEELDLTPLLPE
jgi:hypothetical protein